LAGIDPQPQIENRHPAAIDRQPTSEASLQNPTQFNMTVTEGQRLAVLRTEHARRLTVGSPIRQAVTGKLAPGTCPLVVNLRFGIHAQGQALGAVDVAAQFVRPSLANSLQAPVRWL